MTFGAAKNGSHVQASHTIRRGSDTRRSETSSVEVDVSQAPANERVDGAGWHGRVGGLADCRRKGSNWMDVLSFTSGASRTAELPRRLATWSYMKLWQFQFWTTRGKMKFR